MGASRRAAAPLRYRPAARAFMAEEAADSPLAEDAGAAIIPFPLEASVTFGRGTARGPAAMIAASGALESYDDELKADPMREFGIATLETPEVAARLEDAVDQIGVLCGAVRAAGKLPLILGGEHALTAGAIRPFAEAFDEVAVLQFDAHADLRESYAGSRFNHACAMARALDHANVSLVQVGVRSLSQAEARRIDDSGRRISTYFAREKANWDLAEIVAPLAGKPLYVSFDVDCLDASLMPATGTPEPGGLFFDEACTILRAAIQAGDLVGADVVELAPIGGMAACDVTAAKIAYRILAYGLDGERLRGA